jgi:hypothetical protein
MIEFLLLIVTPDGGTILCLYVKLLLFLCVKLLLFLCAKLLLFLCAKLLLFLCAKLLLFLCAKLLRTVDLSLSVFFTVHMNWSRARYHVAAERQSFKRCRPTWCASEL